MKTVKKERFKKLKELKDIILKKKLEVAVAVFLGITTLLVAWAGWIGSLHGGIQAINFTESNNLASEGNSAYNVAAQIYMSDLFAWNSIFNLQLDMDAARAKGNTEEVKLIETKIDKIKKSSCSPILLDALNSTSVKDGASPFENEAFSKKYFEEPERLINESQRVLEEGKQDNLRGDSYRLVSVIYSLVLFLLGIVGVIKDYQSRKVLFIFSVCILLVGIIYMLTLPMPTGFDLGSFFGVK